MQSAWISVDVGTSSVRAGLFDSKGKQIAYHSTNITLKASSEVYFHHSSVEIWNAVANSVKQVVANSHATADQIKGIGFDATCSLVFLGKDGQPLSLDPDETPITDKCFDTISWMDHRAVSQAKRLEEILSSVVSPEMQLPKVLWVKENLPRLWEKTEYIIDLPDFLTYKATDDNTRSLCSLVCKWKYNSKEGWNETLFEKLSLNITDRNFSMVGGCTPVRPGTPCSGGLSSSAAEQLGLVQGTVVASSIIDAYAGALGVLSLQCENLVPFNNRLSIISGTSACHLAASDVQLSIPGVWGPYLDVMLPDIWITEAGQSAAGKLLDFIVTNDKAFAEISLMQSSGTRPYSEILYDHLKSMAENKNCSIYELGKNYHVYPDYHGNRSPLSDPHLKGSVIGLDLSQGSDALAIKYLATVQALAYSTRHIVEHLEKHGHKFLQIHICGGLAQNKLYLETHADVTGLNIITPKSQDTVLLGGAMLAASASGDWPSLQHVMSAFAGPSIETKPNPDSANYHARKYQVFQEMLTCQLRCRALMEET